MTTPAAQRLPLRIKVFNGLGSVAYGIKDNGFSTLLLIFYSQVVGLDPATVSLALMLVLVVDAFADPVIGHLSDRTYTRWGRRLPWLYVAPLPLAVSWMLLWVPPDDHTHIFLYLVVVAILVRTLVSCCEVPAQSLVAELTTDYDERTALTRFRYLFAWGGGLLLFFLANTVFLRPDATHKVGQLNPEGYWEYGLCGAIIMAGAVIVAALGQHRRIAHWPQTRPEATTIVKALGEIVESLRHPAAVILLGASLIAVSSVQMTFTISYFLYLYVWQLSQAAFALLPWVLLVSVVASFLITQPLHQRYGKRSTAAVCGVISTAFWIVPFGLRLAGWWPPEGSAWSSGLLMLLVTLSNIAAVIVMVSAQSMLADVVEASQIETKRRTEGVFAAGWVFVQKFGTAFGIGIAGQLVSWSGLPRKALPGQVDPAVIDWLSVAYCAIVIVATVASTLVFIRFPINRADHEARLAALDAAARIDLDAGGAHP